jgi:site-specific recombinase XerD
MSEVCHSPFVRPTRGPRSHGSSTAFGRVARTPVEGRVAASTQNQALSALVSLYRDVLEVDLPWLDGVVRAKRPEHVPVVLARDEVRALLQGSTGPRG